MTNSAQRLINVMLGIHLGDALGVPFEAMSRQEILAATDGAGVDGPRFDLKIERRVPDTRDLPPGSTSDDSQLANAVADALILNGGYHQEWQVLHHLAALWKDVAGWGGTTKRSLYEIDKWYRRQPHARIKRPSRFKSERDEKLWDEVEPRNPRHPARWREMSRGNGVAMKIAPLAAFLAAKGGGAFENGQLRADILDFGRITHADPVCTISAYAIASIVYDLARGFGPEGAFMHLAPRIEAIEVELNLVHKGRDRFSYALRQALSLTGEPEALWAFGSEGKSDALTSVPLALAIWYRHCEDREPTAAVLEAINAGGDTDTVASMVGAMMGAASEEPQWWPVTWVAALKDRGVLAKTLGEELHAAAQGRYRGRYAQESQALLRSQLGYT